MRGVFFTPHALIWYFPPKNVVPTIYRNSPQNFPAELYPKVGSKSNFAPPLFSSRVIFGVGWEVGGGRYLS
jgi:hypothetical protein